MIEMDFRLERVEMCCKFQNEIREIQTSNLTEYRDIFEVLGPSTQKRSKLNFNELY
jgi:hypothetical protein